MIYEVVQANRYFDKDRLYASVDWRKLDDVVDAFQKRIRDWYLEPAKELAKNGHFAFSIMALNCLVIDTLSQFYEGIDASTKEAFKKFVRYKLPQYAEELKIPIQHLNRTDFKLTDVADVLYHGFRCGILHEAHITPYGAVDPAADPPVRQESSGYVKYKSNGTDCALVVVNPLKLLQAVCDVFDGYVADLKNRDNKFDELRAHFKAKFSKSYGIDISSAVY